MKARMVPDHWTWRDGKPHVTGAHPEKKRGKQQVEQEATTAVSRGLVTTEQKRKAPDRTRQGQLL